MARPNPMDSSGSDASWIYIVGTDVDGILGASSAQGAGTTDIDDNLGALSAQSAGTSWAQSAATVSGGVFNTAPPCAYNKSSVPFSRVDKQ